MHCSNSLNIDDLDRLSLDDRMDEFKIMSLPCSGKVDLLYLVKAFETGADGIAIITCPKNECRHLEGNLRAPRRAEKVNSLLEEIGIEGERITVISREGEGIENIVSGISDLCDSIRNMVTFSEAKVS